MLRTCQVTYKDQVAGELAETPSGGTRFAYSEGWKERSIACTFPIHQRIFECTRGLHPFFQNLCPEGWLRDGQAKAGRITDDRDDFGFLLRFGKDCIGAVGIVGSSDQSSSLVQDEVAASIGAHKTVSGVQKKLLAYNEDGKFHASADGKPASHIAKFNTDRLPTLVQNEYKSSRLAQKVLGESFVTKFELATICNEVALIIERFDRQQVSDLQDSPKLRMEECAQILGRSSAQKYEGSYEEIANAISEYSSSPLMDLQLYFKQVVFSVIIGNCDAHLKNFALLEVPLRGMRLSPAYDLLNTVMYQGYGYDSRCALALCGDKLQRDKIDRGLLIEFGTKIGLERAAIELTLNKLHKGFKSAKDILKPPKAEEPDGFHSRYKEIVDSSSIRILEE